MFLYFLCYKIPRIQVTSRANENHQAGAFCDFNCNIKNDETVFGNGEAFLNEVLMLCPKLINPFAVKLLSNAGELRSRCSRSCSEAIWQCLFVSHSLG
ncbi:hypothetical protein WN944_014375 [Citrus x changshan-huyou]|uniref:Uncharacterized protein n=1 Tax=Citrus x changshan-huyou TaxID=2935761 RepID=A0AAP0M700_9ROSI